MSKEVIRKTYIGYDLGDGETITDVVTLECGKNTSRTVFDDMTMPDSNEPGKAMPTIFAYDENGKVMFSSTIVIAPDLVKNIVINFKRRPSDLLAKSDKSIVENVQIVKSLLDSSTTVWPSESVWFEGNTEEMIEFKNSVVSFTNSIFTNEAYINKLRTAAMSSDEVVFCVGHPTNWTELDVAIYELIMKNTILGSGKYADKKSSIIMEAESRAAYLYSKDVESFVRLPKGESVLLIDIGSSTIDLTAMTASSNNHQYNTGSNYLGARSIDFMIRDWYLNELKKNPASWSVYESLLKGNPTIPNALTLSCRKAKETLYSTTAGMAVVNFSTFPGIRLTKDILDNIIDNTPISEILTETINLPADEAEAMGNKSWKNLFKDFLIEKKTEMSKMGIKVGHIILTGSASKMPFAPQIVLEVFNEISSDSLGYDMDPSRTISKGLALVGPSNEKSKAFCEDLSTLVDEKLNIIIKNNIPALAEKMGKVVPEIIIPVMKKRILEWKAGNIKTLNEMNNKIKNDCSEANLLKLLCNNKNYSNTIENWLKDTVSKDVAVELKALCTKYGVHDIGVDDLNIMTLPKISIESGVQLDPLEFMNTVSGVVSIIAGIIAYVSSASILWVLISLISIISETIAFSILAFIMANPELYPFIAGLLGISVVVLIKKGFKGIKDAFKDKVMSVNIPKIARKAMTDNKINESFEKADLPKQIKTAFNKSELTNNIVKKVSENLKGQIEKRAEDIKYAIESK